MSEISHSEPKALTSGVYVAAFIILFIILAIFGDLFVFILGTIGLVITFAALSESNKSHAGDHH